jgi:hypothetical protein
MPKAASTAPMRALLPRVDVKKFRLVVGLAFFERWCASTIERPYEALRPSM